MMCKHNGCYCIAWIYLALRVRRLGGVWASGCEPQSLLESMGKRRYYKYITKTLLFKVGFARAR